MAFNGVTNWLVRKRTQSFGICHCIPWKWVVEPCYKLQILGRLIWQLWLFHILSCIILIATVYCGWLLFFLDINTR